ncbi:UDP-N-acetylmuramoyl-tripeptide--D-alanyl-D-alanine ligase [Anaerotaenia torta]|uniref:UDP-N-acetylmuramoyl-tripeptide--D-alanyl-D- alanine ligase n=1 Tax=Anaerotaenia torta TaxID=433293 RepID=UPI003D1C689A
MKNMTLTQIANACNGKLYGDDPGYEIAGAAMDSRKIEKDYLFIASVGERVDGHSFIPQVFEKGAMAVLCEKIPVSPKGPYILVDSSFEALKSIAAWYRSQLDIKVVGITGSVGKTSTKEFISSVLSQKYRVLKTEGNFNNEIGLPLTVLNIREYHDIAVLEMGISDFGEMHRLSKIARPDICVITNIGQCHLENLGSREGILKAKTEIFDFMSENGRVCVNGDDDMLATISEVKGIPPVRFGLGRDNDITASEISAKGLRGSSCTIRMGAQSFSAEIPLPGGHMIFNALAATAVGSLLDMTIQEIFTGIASVKPIGGRSNILHLEQWTIIDDCYNANPVSMKAALDLLGTADTRKVAILGDMGELGDNEKALHREVGEYAAASGIDLLICVGALSLNMYEGAQEQPGSIPLAGNVYCATREELLKALPGLLKQGDTLLVKASHFMGFEEVVKFLSGPNQPA